MGMRKAGFAATLVAGVGLLGTSLHGMTSVDRTLAIAAATPRPRRRRRNSCSRSSSAAATTATSGSARKLGSALSRTCSVRACEARTWSAVFPPTAQQRRWTPRWTPSALVFRHCLTARPASASTGSSTSSKGSGSIRTSSWFAMVGGRTTRTRRSSACARATPCPGCELGHFSAFEASYPLFVDARAAAGLHDLKFQVGIPGDFDMALFVLGPRGALTGKGPFTDATVARDPGHPRASVATT